MTHVVRTNRLPYTVSTPVLQVSSAAGLGGSLPQCTPAESAHYPPNPQHLLAVPGCAGYASVARARFIVAHGRAWHLRCAGWSCPPCTDHSAHLHLAAAPPQGASPGRSNANSGTGGSSAGNTSAKYEPPWGHYRYVKFDFCEHQIAVDVATRLAAIALHAPVGSPNSSPERATTRWLRSHGPRRSVGGWVRSVERRAARRTPGRPVESSG